MSQRAPIGVFDSGLGGLTVARAIMRRLPAESIIYVGDTARVPYGPKSPETVRRYALQIGQWLVGQGVKAVVVACNTATAHALTALRQSLDVPVIGVIDPGARAAARVTAHGPVGVIGTSGTIASGAYSSALHAIAPGLTVVPVACPLLVPLVEEGWIDHPATRLVLHEYLQPLRQAAVDTVVLGCTHYPLLRTAIAAEMGPAVTLIDSAEETAAELATVLGAMNALAVPAYALADASSEASTHAPVHRVVASDAPQHFLTLGNRFLDRPIERVEHHVFT